MACDIRNNMTYTSINSPQYSTTYHHYQSHYRNWNRCHFGMTASLWACACDRINATNKYDLATITILLGKFVSGSLSITATTLVNAKLMYTMSPHVQHQITHSKHEPHGRKNLNLGIRINDLWGFWWRYYQWGYLYVKVMEFIFNNKCYGGYLCLVQYQEEAGAVWWGWNWKFVQCFQMWCQCVKHWVIESRY